jgi:hypothetical protein
LHGRQPWSPPIVELAGDGTRHLLCWDSTNGTGPGTPGVSWVQSTGDPVRYRHHVVAVRADAVRRLENPDAYAQVPHRVLGSDGRIRPWTSPAPATPGTYDPRDQSGHGDRPGRSPRQ